MSIRIELRRKGAVVIPIIDNKIVNARKLLILGFFLFFHCFLMLFLFSFFLFFLFFFNNNFLVISFLLVV